MRIIIMAFVCAMISFSFFIGTKANSIRRAVAEVQYGYSVYPELQIARANKLEAHENIPVPDGALFLIGDSIMELMPTELLLQRFQTANYGIRGDNIRGVLERINTNQLANAGAVVIMIGVNDLQAGSSPEGLEESLRSLSSNLCSIGAPVYWLSTLPVNPGEYQREILTRSPTLTMPTPELVAALNNVILSSTAECPRINYIDIWPSFTGIDGVLLVDKTIDGLHLSSNGMALLAEVISSIYLQ